MNRETRAGRKIALVLVWLIAFLSWGLLVPLVPLLDDIRAELNLTYSDIGLIFSVPIGIVAFLSLLGGFLADRFGWQKIIGIGATVIASSTILRGLSFDFQTLVLFSAVYGLGFGLTLPNFSKMVGSSFEPSFAGTASGIYGTGALIGLGVVLVITPMSILPLMASWRGVSFFWGTLGLVISATWWMTIQHPKLKQLRPASSMSNGESRQPKEVLKDLRLWFASSLLFLENSFFYSMIAWLPTYLDVKGFDVSLGSAITALIPFAGIPTIFLVPYLSDRIGSRKPFLIMATLTMTVASYLFTVAPPYLITLLVIVLGAAVNSWFILCLILPVDIAPPRLVGTASGIVLSIGYAGGLFGPWLLGYLLDITRNSTSGLAALVGFAVIGLALSLGIPKNRRELPSFRFNRGKS